MKTFLNLLVGLTVFFGTIVGILYLFKNIDKSCGYVEIYDDEEDMYY